jgi:hypothetical protein
MNWKPEVMLAGESDKWHQNALVFATKEEAEQSARDLYNRWALTIGYRAAESNDPVNYALVDGQLKGVRQ